MATTTSRHLRFYYEAKVLHVHLTFKFFLIHPLKARMLKKQTRSFRENRNTGRWNFISVNLNMNAYNSLRIQLFKFLNVACGEPPVLSRIRSSYGLTASWSKGEIRVVLVLKSAPLRRTAYKLTRAIYRITNGAYKKKISYLLKKMLRSLKCVRLPGMYVRHIRLPGIYARCLIL